MTTASAIAAWEAEGLRLLSTSAKAEVLAELRAAAERIALASRARSAPGFDRCAALVCAFLGPPELGVVATCSNSMKRIAREDHLWQPLIRRFSCVEDLRRAGSTLTGFRECARLVRLWNHPDHTSSEPPPGMDAYSVVLEIKIDGRRIVGGVYELEDIRTGPNRGKGFGLYDLDPAGLLAPSALEARPELMTVSICVVRKSDKKCLHLITDTGVYDFDDDYIDFDGLIAHQRRGGGCCSSFNIVDGDLHEECASHDFRLWGAVWNEPGDVLRGFTSPHGELRLWDPVEPCAVPMEMILARWHASKNWV